MPETTNSAGCRWLCQSGEPNDSDDLLVLSRDMTSAAYAASGIGWIEAAEMLCQALPPFADQIPHVAVTTSGCQVNHYLGLLAASLRRDCEAEFYFAQAAATHERIGAAHAIANTAANCQHHSFLATDS
jgi:hypothetical protein